MKVTINKQLQVSIEDMDGDEVQALIEMIRGAGIIERRIFSRVLIDLTRRPTNKLEMKEDSLEKFKSLQHISRDLHQTLEDWGYAPNLYYFDGSWHVDWISCEEGDSVKGFTEDTAEEAINKAYNWFHSTFCNSDLTRKPADKLERKKE